VESVPISSFREKSDIKVFLKANYKLEFTPFGKIFQPTNSIRLQEKEIENKRAGLGCFDRKNS
jgi:hypothetical protein